MSGQYLNAISENATRLGMRLQETFSEHTRDLTTRGTSAAYLDSAATATDEKTKLAIRKQLDGNSDRDKLDAMKRLVALISKGRNVSEYFAPVVKLVASPNLEIRKLVYIYLLRYAEHEPDLALLSINTFQKDLADSSPLIRAMALRVLSGIRVPMIGSIVVLAIKKCAADVSPYVRKAAALAIPKCYELDPSHLSALIQIITTLLKDRSPLSLGCVAVAFEAVCPTRLDLLHIHYRRLCKILVDVDEWGQVDLMNLLLRYARTMLPRPMGRRGGVLSNKEGEGEDDSVEGRMDGEEEVDPDVKLLIQSVEPTFQSRNPAVVMAATKVLFYAAPLSYWPKFVHPLLRLLMTSKEVERVVLVDLIIITNVVPSLFSPFYARFLVRSDDLIQVKKDKINLLLNVLTVDNYAAIMREFMDYADDVDDSVVAEAIRALGRCAIRIPESVQQCLTALMTMIKSPYDAVVSSAVLMLQYLVQTQLSVQSPMMSASTSQSPLSIIARLARKIDDIKHAQARACVVWLVGQYAASDERGPGPEGVAEWAPDVLRKLAKTFGQETSLVKLQVVTLAAKLFVLSPGDVRLGLLSRYVFSLARYDVNYDVRDRGRMLSTLLAGVGLQVQVNGTGAEEKRGGVVLRREQVRLVLFEGKSGVKDEKLSFLADDERVLVGSLSRATGKFMQTDAILPDWLERGVEGALRDSEYDAPAVPAAVTALSSAGQRATKGVASPIVLTPTGGSPRPGSRNGNKGAFTDLDSFYAENEAEAAGSEAESEGEDGSGSEPDEDESGSEEEESSEGDDDVIGQS
ncbi:adaptin N terminal region-domain-containing protein [Crassisporium funariophilum]|nr:adaptin N terminal region-domain-containing protein [Crassisporium funariophilum]